MVILIIAINYTVEYDEARKVYRIRNKDAPFCPDCGQLLSGYDTRARHVIDSAGQICWYRFATKGSGCKKLHLELPDFMAPKKHYEARVIQDVLSGKTDSCPADNSKIRRWRKK